MSQRAFSLMEIIVVLVIMLLLTALLTPTFVRAKQSAREAQAVSNLRSIFVATEIYRTDNDGQGVYGDAFDMGMPHLRLIEYGPPKAWEVLPGTNGLWMSPCGTHPDLASGVVNTDLSWYPASELTEPDNIWAQYARRHEQDSVFLSDDNCNDHSKGLRSPFIEHKFFGVALDGSIKKRFDSVGRSGFLVWQP